MITDLQAYDEHLFKQMCVLKFAAKWKEIFLSVCFCREKFSVYRET